MGKPIDRATADRFVRVVHKHAATITLDALFDMTKALGLKLDVRVIDKAGEA